MENRVVCIINNCRIKGDCVCAKRTFRVRVSSRKGPEGSETPPF